MSSLNTNSSTSYGSKKPAYSNGKSSPDDDGSKLQDKIAKVEEKAVEKFEDTKQVAQDTYREVKSYIKNADTRQVLDDLRKFATQKPMTAIGLGVGIGYILSRAFGSRR